MPAKIMVSVEIPLYLAVNGEGGEKGEDEGIANNKPGACHNACTKDDGQCCAETGRGGDA